MSFVMGGSGCERKYLLKSMVGLLEPVAGNVFINGDALWGDESNMTQVLREFGVLFQGALWIR